MLNPRISTLLSSIDGLSHGFFTRQGGVSQGPFTSLNGSTKYGDSPENVSENRKRIEDYLKGSLITAQQVHGTDIISLTSHSSDFLVGDGLITEKKGQMVGVLTADCVPLLWVCPDTKQVAAVHSGWKGTLGGIIENARHYFKNPPFVAIGPAISQTSFEVGIEVKEAFCHKDLSSKKFFLQTNATFLFDLPGYIKHLLKHLKVREIDWIQENTYSSEDIYFSYRRSTHRQEQAFGVMVSAIGWKNPS